tara:strand:+ start:181 stop:387 length:207 start_codon:yes stop_codon:yes gene_type:complete
MRNSILIQELKIGQEFILLNKRGLQKTNSTYLFIGINKKGNLVDYERTDKSKFYASMSTRGGQYVELI